MLTFDENMCTRCGACVKICPDSVMRLDEGDSVPQVVRGDYCERCGHCVAVCPADAVRHSELASAEFSEISGELPSDDSVEALLATKRSVRQFSERPVEPEVLERLLNVARMAPSDNNCQDRGFIVASDPKKLSAIEDSVVDGFASLLFWMPRPVRRILGLFLPGLIGEFEKALPSLDDFVARSRTGERLVFRHAPCVVFIHGPAGNTLSRDNCLASQHYLMLQAHAMGLGSCIIGYATSMPNAMKRHLDLPRGHKVYAVNTLGYPESTFAKIPARKSAEVRFYKRGQ